MKIILTESQFNRVILKEQSHSFPITVKGSFNSEGNCDYLHAFQSSGGNVVGNMNVIVGDKLKEIYELGYAPEVTQVNISVNGETVNWSVTINESKDGKAWMGFTSRGAGCNNDIENRATSTQSGNDIGTLRNRIVSAGLNSNDEFELEEVNDYVYDGGKDSFKQVFYRYTRPNDYPSHSKDKEITDNSFPLIKHNNDQATFISNLKGLGNIPLSDFTPNDEGLKVWGKIGNDLVSMSYIYSPTVEGLKEVLETVKKANKNTPVIRNIEYNINGLPGYILIFKQW